MPTVEMPYLWFRQNFIFFVAFWTKTPKTFNVSSWNRQDSLDEPTALPYRFWGTSCMRTFAQYSFYAFFHGFQTITQCFDISLWNWSTLWVMFVSKTVLFWWVSRERAWNSFCDFFHTVLVIFLISRKLRVVERKGHYLGTPRTRLYMPIKGYFLKTSLWRFFSPSQQFQIFFNIS